MIKTPLKKFTIGFEVEFLIIDKKTGKVVPGSEAILKKADEKSDGKPHDVVKESVHEMIEVGSYPNVEGVDTMKSLLKNLKLLTYAADEVGYAVLPLGTYPGRFTPTNLNNKRYNMYNSLAPKGLFGSSWGHAAGYHCHYSLPRGTFDTKNLILKDLENSKNQENLVNAYNFLISIDPVLATFMQSSPFYQGKRLAKDSRMVVLRGDRVLGNYKSWLTKHPILSELPPYVHTVTDISQLAEKRQREWFRWTTKAGFSEKEAMEPFASILNVNWSPLRVNPHGTFEHRGMDMNRLPVLLSVSILIQVLLRNIQDGHLKVIPHDMAKTEPFKLDKVKKILYITPDTYVKNHLQKLSAYEGLANDEIYIYCKRLVGLAKLLGGEKVKPLLQPLEAMLLERKTTSDHILDQARELGYTNNGKILPQKIASRIAIRQSKQMFEDIVILEKMIEINERFGII